jgi:GntR family transcriptional regulator, transcriptional repressor for pyruvate dehydrogenase complex
MDKDLGKDKTERRKARPLALDLVDTFAERVRDGRLAPGDKLPSEAAIMGQFGVSRTVVREAISKLQAGGLVRTRHGIGTFVHGGGKAVGLRISPAEQMATLLDVVAVLELRLGIEAEAAALAATRRSAAELRAMRQAQDDFERAVHSGGDTVEPDLRLHQEIARASHNTHFTNLMATLGRLLIPRSRVDTSRLAGEDSEKYLMRVHAEHDSFVNAIANRDPEAARAAIRTHLSNSRDRLRRAQALATKS